MRSGFRQYYTYRYLGGQGFLPNYAFPRESTQVIFSDTEDEMNRGQVVALREYAPGNSVYYKGSRHQILYARPRARLERPAFENLLVCNQCRAAYLGSDTKRSVCSSCSKTMTESHPNPHALEMPNMFAMKRTSITADEEERTRLGYRVETHYRPGLRIRIYEVKGNNSMGFRVSYEHNGRVITVNAGPRQAEKKDELKGFTLCQKCNRWLFGDDRIEDHFNPDKDRYCSKRATQEDIIRGVELYSDSHHDVVVVDWPAPEGADTELLESFYVTLLHSLQRGVEIALNLDESEVDGFLMPLPNREGHFQVVLYETSVGGEGAVESLTQANRLQLILEATREILHDGEEGCERACYECLCSFYNQVDHIHLNRNLVLPSLQALVELEIEEVDTPATGLSYEELLAKCQSGFEREVLEAIRKASLPLPDDGQVTIRDGDVPIASADFFYEPKIAIFVDGSPHYLDYIAAADETKRNKLKAKGYRILAIRSDNILDELKRLAAWLGVTGEWGAL